MEWKRKLQCKEMPFSLILALSLSLLPACAHDPKLDKKIADELQNMPAETSSQRHEEGHKAIAEAPLSEKQKARLGEISDQAMAELKTLREEENKLRLLLIRQFANPDASDREIDAIKRRILEANQRSNKRWLSALDEARQVIGRRSEKDAKFYQSLLQETSTPEGAGRVQ